MENEVFQKLYLKIAVPHIVRLMVGVLTIDNVQVSIVMDFASQIG